MQALELVTLENVDWTNKRNAEILRHLERVNATPEQVTRFGEWWKANDWRGKKGELPTLPNVWGEWRKGTQPRAEREWTETYA
jgi:hypothetical protein